MARTLPLHRTPPERFLPTCPVATPDEGSSPAATRSEPHKVPARRDHRPCRRRAVCPRHPSLPEVAVIFHERHTGVLQRFPRTAVEAEQLHEPIPTRQAAWARRSSELVPRPSVGGSAASVKLLPMVKCYA
uniref:(northern house mosquito) hypothetical protein n=1 Tax=Culex pipiens TaxID=7175 RepID=A0A8D8BLM6_CULPI